MITKEETYVPQISSEEFHNWSPIVPRVDKRNYSFTVKTDLQKRIYGEKVLE